jgi:hypothetical protein
MHVTAAEINHELFLVVILVLSYLLVSLNFSYFSYLLVSLVPY